MLLFLTQPFTQGKDAPWKNGTITAALDHTLMGEGDNAPGWSLATRYHFLFLSVKKYDNNDNDHHQRQQHHLDRQTSGAVPPSEKNGRHHLPSAGPVIVAVEPGQVLLRQSRPPRDKHASAATAATAAAAVPRNTPFTVDAVGSGSGGGGATAAATTVTDAAAGPVTAAVSGGVETRDRGVAFVLVPGDVEVRRRGACARNMQWDFFMCVCVGGGLV